jgi:hypothetical protein
LGQTHFLLPFAKNENFYERCHGFRKISSLFCKNVVPKVAKNILQGCIFKHIKFTTLTTVQEKTGIALLLIFDYEQ